MQNPRSRILERYRLRPQKKGRLPNYTKDFEEYTDKITQVIKNHVQFSFQLNKFGMEKRRKISNLNQILSVKQKNLTQECEQSKMMTPHEIKMSGKHLKYNQTRISPNHKMKIREKSAKKHNKQNSLPVISQMRQLKLDKQNNDGKFPKINLTSRQMNDSKFHPMNKENEPYQSKTSRVHHYEINQKDKYYTKLYHIVTMGRKQVQNQN